jgi:hypothetical protein
MVFRCVPLFCSCSTCMVSWMGSKECICSIKCFAKFDDWLAVLNAFLCSLMHVVKFHQFVLYMLFRSSDMSICTLTVSRCLCCGFCVIVVFVRNCWF